MLLRILNFIDRNFHVTLLMLQEQLHKRTTMDFEKTSFEMSISALKNGLSQVDSYPL